MALHVGLHVDADRLTSLKFVLCHVETDFHFLQRNNGNSPRRCLGLHLPPSQPVPGPKDLGMQPDLSGMPYIGRYHRDPRFRSDQAPQKRISNEKTWKSLVKRDFPGSGQMLEKGWKRLYRKLGTSQCSLGSLLTGGDSFRFDVARTTSTIQLSARDKFACRTDSDVWLGMAPIGCEISAGRWYWEFEVTQSCCIETHHGWRF